MQPHMCTYGVGSGYNEPAYYCGTDSTTPEYQSCLDHLSSLYRLPQCTTACGTEVLEPTCDACAAGKFRAGDADAACEDCEAGKYQQYQHKDYCDDCHANSDTAAPGSTHPTDCMCDKGYYGVLDAQLVYSCQPCASGRDPLCPRASERGAGCITAREPRRIAEATITTGFPWHRRHGVGTGVAFAKQHDVGA